MQQLVKLKVMIVQSQRLQSSFVTHIMPSEVIHVVFLMCQDSAVPVCS